MTFARFFEVCFHSFFFFKYGIWLDSNSLRDDNYNRYKNYNNYNNYNINNKHNSAYLGLLSGFLWQRLHLLQRIRDCQLLSHQQHSRAGRLWTGSQLCRQMFSPWSIALSLRGLFWWMWDTLWGGRQWRHCSGTFGIGNTTIICDKTCECFQVVLSPM